MMLLCSVLAVGGRLAISAFDSPAAAEPSTAAMPAAPATAASAAPTDAAVPVAASASSSSFDAADAADDVSSVLATLRASGSDVSIAAYGEDSGLSYEYGADDDFDAASVVKVDILATLLLQHQDSGTALSAAELSLATSMIEHSDNDAASGLWYAIGGDEALTKANVRLGLTQTVAGADGYWGLTQTSSADQVQLLRDLVNADSALNADSQQLILSLMSHVEDAQSWGVSAAADDGTTASLKNGWLSEDDGSWTVNSIGRITVNGHAVILAILSRGADSEDDGIQLVQRLAEAVAGRVAG